jgi:hypothetical protein
MIDGENMVDINDLFDLDELLTVEKLLVLVGGLLLTISVFFNYMVIEGDDADVFTDTTEYKGTDYEELEEDTEEADEPVELINPYFTLILGILCILAGIIPRGFDMLQGFMPIVLIVLGVISLGIVYMNYGEIKDSVDELTEIIEDLEDMGADIDVEAKVGIGIWLGFIGALLVIVGGALCFVFKEDDKWIRLKK